MRVLKNKLALVPTPLVGLALGIASTGKLLILYGYDQYVSIFVAAFILILVLAKFLTTPKLLLEDLKHPVLGSIIPTFAMTLMIISSEIPDSFAAQAELLWYIAIGLHITLFLSFMLMQVRHFDLANILPSWFIPPVGLAVAALTCPGTQSAFIAQYLLYFAIAMYFLLLPIMLFRLILLPIIDATKPTIAILAAPPNLCLAAYLTFVEQPSTLLVFILMGFALLMTALVYLSLIVLVQLPFSPAFAGFTFPLVISATASIKACAFLEKQPVDTQGIDVLQMIATAQLYIACAMVSYVIIRYLRFYQILPTLVSMERFAKGNKAI